MQQKWTTAQKWTYPSNTAGNDKKKKYLITFPYPYMNGRLHLGHGFSLSKCEFAAGYRRMRGHEVLWPFGFHCTGMPIKACADKLSHEIALLEGRQVSEALIDASSLRQHRIMLDSGVALGDIHKFANAQYWIEYFPLIAVRDLQSFGAKIDWTRSFTTIPKLSSPEAVSAVSNSQETSRSDVVISDRTSRMYQRFVEWQFNTLKKKNLIKYGKRMSIYSPLDGQVCLDHDRQSGEGVQPQQWTLIKLPIINENRSNDNIKNDEILIAATLRPETMFGQTNCFVGRNVEYAKYYSARDQKTYICLPRVFDNLGHQTELDWQFKGTIKGADLVGTSVQAPLSRMDIVAVLPMDSISEKKGSGIVTSVPSDSPDDFMMLQELKRKPAYYGIDDRLHSQIESIEVLGIIESTTYGDMIAPRICEQMGIKSPRDMQALKEAKEVAYKDGFYSARMSVPEYRGMPVREAREVVRKRLIDGDMAVDYYEPEHEVVSRTGDRCVAALTNQWYLNYSDPEWKRQVHECIDAMEATYHEETRNGLHSCVDWLNDWGCARKYGLGTRLPWDKEWLVESLSDSTIYMAFYTVSNLFDKHQVESESMTDDVWNFVFSLRRDDISANTSQLAQRSGITVHALEEMKREFENLYPMDLRVSGKDLINNHLTFSLFNHTAIFPKDKWPRSFRVNGHLMLNNQKMSKSTGNFLTLRDSIDRYGADATRLTLAEAGDGVDDANFDEELANSNILKLYSLKQWIESQTAVTSSETLVIDFKKLPWIERAFLNEMSECVGEAERAYENMEYFLATKWGFHLMLKARDFYTNYYKILDRPNDVHKGTINEYIKTLLLTVTPIIPHFSEYMWSNVLRQDGFIVDQNWPSLAGYFDPLVASQKRLLESVVKEARSVMARRNKKASQSNDSDHSNKTLTIYASKGYSQWQKSIINSLNDAVSNGADFASLKPQDFLTPAVELELSESQFDLQRDKKKFMSFLNQSFAQVKRNPSPINIANDYDECEFLLSQQAFIKNSLRVSDVRIEYSPKAGPGNPQYLVDLSSKYRDTLRV